MRKKHLIIIAAILAFFVGIFLIWLSLPWRVELTLSGTQEMTLEYGREYIEAGAQARASKLFYSTAVAVEQTGTVDDSRLGTYEICYKASFGKTVATESRIVHIVDTEPPVIELVGGEDYSILPGTRYAEPGYAAADNYDGDLTQQVSVSRYGGKIRYSVTDSSGNRTFVRRTVTERDMEAPQITLTGEAYVEVKLGGYYRELGCTATDDCDGDITHRVEITGAPDTFTPGTYQVCYRVSDLFGNQTEAIRTVCVTPAEGVTVAAYNGKNIYLTFDDGPGPYTQALLDVLGKYDIPATFFVTGSGYDDLLTRMADEGHTVAMHTYCHRYSQIYSSEEAYFADLGLIQEKIESCTGQKPTLLRFPGGSSNTVSRGNKGIMTRLAALMEEQGYTYFDWNVDSRDAGGATSASEVFYNVINGVQRQRDAVVLQHDVKGFSVDAVERIILWGLENGYRFLPLTADSPTCHHTIAN